MSDQPDLFQSLDDARRSLLRARGWREAGSVFHGLPFWAAPGGEIVDEANAFARLDRELAAESAGSEELD
jgi:hypothetical protein